MKMRTPLLTTACGALAGYLLISPLAVYVTHTTHRHTPVRAVGFLEIFSHEPASWSLPFAIFGAAAGLLVGLLHRRLREKSEKVREAKEYIDLMVDSMGEGMLTIDREYRIVMTNRAYLRQVGEERREKVVGAHCYQVSHKTAKPCFEMGEDCPVRRVFETGAAATAAHVHRSKGGDAVYVELSAYPVTDAAGNVVQALEVSRNVTERKRAEETLRGYAEELERSNRMKELFTDILSHDLLNPLGIIRYVAESLPEEVRRAEPERYDLLLRNINKMQELLQNAAKYAHLETTDHLEMKELDLAAILGSVTRELRPYAAAKEQEIVFEPPAEVRALVNPMIEEVFSNIISNAVKYAPAKTAVAVTIADEDDGWSVAVADRGAGIPAEHREAIFQRFVRKDKQGVKGSGLGLTIAKRIMDLHGGRIRVDDNPGGGSIFIISIPKR